MRLSSMLSISLYFAYNSYHVAMSVLERFEDAYILHELCHLEEKNHCERFVALMDKYMPMWREVKATLNEQTLDY